MQKPSLEAGGILEEAARAVRGPRHEDYGDMREGFQRAATMMNAILGGDVIIDARHVPLFMIAVKLSRLTASPDHRDSIVDIAGWAECYAQIMDRPFRVSPIRSCHCSQKKDRCDCI